MHDVCPPSPARWTCQQRICISICQHVRVNQLEPDGSRQWYDYRAGVSQRQRFGLGAFEGEIGHVIEWDIPRLRAREKALSDSLGRLWHRIRSDPRLLIGSALAASLRRGGLLLPVLVLPLTVPVLIFGVSASNAAIVGPLPFGTPFTILVALSLASLVLGPFAAAAALRHGLE